MARIGGGERGRERGGGRAGAPPRTGPRRAPAAEERQLDADRSRQLLLSAALEEFAAKGYAGARVQDIADRAGLNKQLITYYFGGKEGLYLELHREWVERKATAIDPGLPLDELVVRMLEDALSDPRQLRLVMWRGLGEGADVLADSGIGMAHVKQYLAGLERREAEGELDAGLDQRSVLLVLLGAIAAPIAMPHVVRELFQAEPGSPEFERHYGEQLRRIIRHLTG